MPAYGVHSTRGICLNNFFQPMDSVPAAMREGGMIKLCRTAEEPKVPSRGNWTLIKDTYADLTSINDD